MKKLILLTGLSIFTGFAGSVYAQVDVNKIKEQREAQAKAEAAKYNVPVLPEIKIELDKNGRPVLSWYCQYDGVKSIAVQRSSDSVVNYNTIAYINKPPKGALSYTDERPQPGANFYKLFIVFDSDVTWWSSRNKAVLDSATFLQTIAVLNAVPANVVPGKTGTTNTNPANPGNITKAPAGTTTSGTTTVTTTPTATTPPAGTLKVPSANTGTPGASEPVKETGLNYTPSTYVFTNPFTGHVNIQLPLSATPRQFGIKFYDQTKRLVLDIENINESKVVLDKRNFRSKGYYSFELFESGTLKEKGFITIY
jgi:hypothetical protein